MKWWLVVGMIVAGFVVVFSLLQKDLLLSVLAHFGQAEVRSDRNEQVVVLDSWWSGDYAKGGCEQAKSWMQDNKSLINQMGCDAVTACPDVMPRYTACMTALNGPTAVARHFEDELMTQFAIYPNCKGVTFAQYYGPHEKVAAAAQAAMDKRHWSLIIDYNVGASVQVWTLQDHDLRLFHQGEGTTPAKIASDVCAIVMGHGGILAR